MDYEEEGEAASHGQKNGERFEIYRKKETNSFLVVFVTNRLQTCYQSFCGT